ncbi:MAG: hypothetical protein KY467_04765 [Gemmatimonadetes bacterium]|nr:hypothetical protein [Gemmatimonadota bacterium]
MADIDIERKRGGSWMWVLGLVLLALVIWLLWGLFDGDDEAAVVEPVAAPVVDEVQPLPPAANPPTPVAQAAGIPVSQIIESPATWTGRTVGGEVRVTEVVSDRGFWIEDQGERLFVLINESGPETPDVNQGQTLRIREAVVYGAQNLANIPGTLEPQARQIAQGQPVVLATDGRNIEILTRPTN